MYKVVQLSAKLLANQFLQCLLLRVEQLIQIFKVVHEDAIVGRSDAGHTSQDLLWSHVIHRVSILMAFCANTRCYLRIRFQFSFLCCTILDQVLPYTPLV